ncbi:HNH endonuclease [Vibrio harveyi]|uniref:HNH endonuclease n=1 Tax=Vibrio harveyi TaxID=669 RepID=UPI003B000F75
MKSESRTSFVNRVMGLSFKSTQGKYSYCNDERKQVLFSLDSANGESSQLILSESWSKNGVAHSLKHIRKVRDEGYDLLIFRTKTRQNRNGNTVCSGFEPYLEKRKLLVDGTNYFAIEQDILFADEVFESGSPYFEGAKKQITVNTYERDKSARKKCLDIHGYICKICSFNFEKVYGELGKEFIHVHHIVPLAKVNALYQVDPVKDLIPVCPNCHAMLHKGGSTILPSQLREVIEQIANKQFKSDS